MKQNQVPFRSTLISAQPLHLKTVTLTAFGDKSRTGDQVFLDKLAWPAFEQGSLSRKNLSIYVVHTSK